MIEELEVNQDNLAIKHYLGVVANILESYNKKIVESNGDISLDDNKKILQDINESYSLYVQLKTSTLDTDLSQVQILDNNLTIKIEELNTLVSNIQAKLDNNEFVGPIGKNSYELALDNGFLGNITEYLASLKGDPFTFQDFTPEQKQELKGEPFTFQDLTPEQKQELKGDTGLSAYQEWLLQNGNYGKSFEDFRLSLKGVDGLVTFESLTQSQKDSLKGDPFTFQDFTPEQKQELKGDTGLSVYQEWLLQDANEGKSFQEFKETLKGADGFFYFDTTLLLDNVSKSRNFVLSEKYNNFNFLLFFCSFGSSISFNFIPTLFISHNFSVSLSFGKDSVSYVFDANLHSVLLSPFPPSSADYYISKIYGIGRKQK